MKKQWGLTVDDIMPLLESVRNARYPHKIFEINFLSFHTVKDSYIKIGTRTPFVDFPRIAWIIAYNDIPIYCENILRNFISPEQMKEYLHNAHSLDISRLLVLGVGAIQKERKNYLSPLFDLDNYLKKLGIGWSVTYQWWYRRPVLKIYLDKYYKTVWIEKIKNFVSLLSRGYDDPEYVYKVSSELAVEYSKLNYGGIVDTEKRPIVFEYLKEIPYLSILYELQKLSSVTEKIITVLKINATTEYDLILKAHYQALISDMKNSIYQLNSIYQSGHYAGGYHLLRHLIQDLGWLVINDFLSNASKEVLPEIYPRNPIEASKKAGEQFNNTLETLKDYLDNFSSMWLDYTVVDHVGVPYLKIRDVTKIGNVSTNTSLDATSLKAFGDIYHSGKLSEKIKQYQLLKLSDSVLYQSLDAILIYKRTLGDIIVELLSEREISEDLRNGKVRTEYRKLSTAVHNPVLVDFPPYGSTIEYLGFLHHLKIIRKIFEDTLKIYKKTSKNKKGKRNIG